jgi:hypothetical protein
MELNVAAGSDLLGGIRTGIAAELAGCIIPRWLDVSNSKNASSSWDGRVFFLTSPFIGRETKPAAGRFRSGFDLYKTMSVI